MITPTKCQIRGCKHFLGSTGDLDSEGNPTEINERPICAAFPEGIPEAIAFGENLHLEPYSGDNGIQFEAWPQQSQ